MLKKFLYIKKYIRGFGLAGGCKLIWHLLLQKIRKGKQSCWVSWRKTKGYVYMREHTTDIGMTDALLGADEADYDFLIEDEAAKDAKVVVDAGANIGLFSLIVRSVNSDAEIYAIEPDPGNYEICRKNLCGGHDIVLNAGLWNKCTNLSIKENPSGVSEIGFIVQEDVSGEIDAITIPYIMEKYHIERIDILKIDIEGSEKQVFDDSANKWIDKVGMLIIETRFHDAFCPGCTEQVSTFMSGKGFSHERIGENDVYRKIKKTGG